MPFTSALPHASLILALAAASFGAGMDAPSWMPREKGGDAEREAEIRRSLDLRGDPETCLAYYTREQRCFATLEDFNKAGRAYRVRFDASPGMDDASRIKNARKHILRHVLRENYLEWVLDQPSEAARVDKEVRKRRKKKLDQMALALGDTVLRQAYRQHYAGLFAPREELEAEVIATTDSALADSIWRIEAKAEAADSARQASRPFRPQASADSLGPIWRRFRTDSLPPAVAAAAARAGLHRISPPVKTRFAYFLVRPVLLRTTPEVRYEDALPVLISLAVAPPMETGKIDMEIRAYYENNRGRFVAPDTLVLEAWLAPPYKHARKGGAPENAGAADPDTARLRPFRLTQFDLPGDVADRVESAPKLAAGAWLGPWKTTLGKWRFRVLSIRKGGAGLSLAQARGEIREILWPGAGDDPVENAQATVQRKERDAKRGVFLELREREARAASDSGSAEAAIDRWIAENIVVDYRGSGLGSLE